MKYKIYSKTKNFLDGLWKDIDNAKTSIYIEMYIFLDDKIPPYNFTELLISKAKEGISVALVLDRFGSKELTQKDIRNMEAAGININFFSDWLRRTHRKIVMIDEKIVFFG